MHPGDGWIPWRRLSGRLRHAAGGDDHLPIDPDLAPDDPGEPSRAHRPVPGHRRRGGPAVLAAIGAGGALGTLARYGAERLQPPAGGAFPVATLLINTTGAFAIGVVLTLILERFTPRPYLRPFLCVGFLGGWTTVSAYAVESALLIRHGDVATAAAYSGATLFSGVVAVAAGIAVARRRDRV